LKFQAFEYWTLALDGRTDVSDTAQLAIFLTGVYEEFNITEEMVAFVPFKGTTEARVLLQGFATSTLLGLNVTNLLRVLIASSPAVVERREKLVMSMDEDLIKVGNDSVIQYHCLIHKENLYAKSLKAEGVITVVLTVVEFVRS
jgi:hypothetical protein